jgi:Putative zinc-binding metallo-peptidase
MKKGTDTDQLVSKFTEAPARQWSEESEKILQMRISELGLKLEGTYLEELVDQLYRELDSAGIKLRPKVYLSDEWGCPEGVPVISIPFYLADNRLSMLEDEYLEGIEGKSEEEILMYLRHEAGHAFNYAYRLYDTSEWREIFGPYSRPYQEDFKPNPFSRSFVRHIPGWYAQKHPDEDFAETFAVWLTPDENWRESYNGWEAYRKLLYVDRIVKELGRTDPPVTGDEYDLSGEQLHYSLAEYNKLYIPQLIDIPCYFDGDLKTIFEKSAPEGSAGKWKPAHEFLMEFRRSLVDNICYWTGLHDAVVRSLLLHFIDHSKELKLWVDPDEVQDTLIKVTAYATALCMNKLYKGDFIPK